MSMCLSLFHRSTSAEESPACSAKWPLYLGTERDEEKGLSGDEGH